jgi:cell wall assembly regulator SMI1
MTPLLADFDAALLCRTHQPSLDRIRQITRWALADPAPEKIAPMLVLFTRHWAAMQYEVLNGLYDAMARCAVSDATPLWECVNGDYDFGRISAANRVLYRVGLRPASAPDSSVQATQEELAAYEARRAMWPAERDQLPIAPAGVQLSDEEARAICRSFKPAPARMREAIDWALAEPAPRKAAYLLILQTGNYAFGNRLAERLEAALKACAAIDPEPLFDWLARDYDMYRNWAAARALISLGSQEIVARLLLLNPEGIGWAARSDIVVAAVRCGLSVPNEALSVAGRSMASVGLQSAAVIAAAMAASQPPTGNAEIERRRQAWPKEFDRLPRQTPHPMAGVRRPELSYPTQPTALTASLERVKAWFLSNNPGVAAGLRPGLTQQSIAELASQLSHPLPAEVCELFRWSNGSTKPDFPLDSWRPFASLAEVVERHREMNEFAREFPNMWRPEWLPLFDEGHSMLVVSLPVGPEPTAPILERWYDDERVNTRYPSLTIMMAVLADAYEEGVFQVDEDGHMDEDSEAMRRLHSRYALPDETN